MFKFTVETTSKKLTELLTSDQIIQLQTTKRNVNFQFIIQVVWTQDVHINLREPATLDSYLLYSWNEKEDEYPNLEDINLIAEWANNTDVRIITT